MLVASTWLAPAQTNFRSLTYEEAIATAKAEQKLVFMDFYTAWCGPCKMMMRDVFPQKKVGDYLNARFVCIKLDAEKEGRELARRYKVKAYPTFVGVDVTGKEVMRRVGMAMADDFINLIEQQINVDKTPERLVERYAAGERSADLISSYAALKMTQYRESRGKEEQKRQEAYDMVRNYFRQLDDMARLDPANLFMYLNYTESPADEMARYMIAHRDEFSREVKDEVFRYIGELYDRQIENWLVCEQPYDEETYQEVCRGMDKLALNRDGKYTAALKLIESHATGDLNAYLAVCRKQYSRLTSAQRNRLSISFSSVITTENEKIRTKASKFLRARLANMEADQLMWVAMELQKLEGKSAH